MLLVLSKYLSLRFMEDPWYHDWCTTQELTYHCADTVNSKSTRGPKIGYAKVSAQKNEGMCDFADFIKGWDWCGV